MKIFQKNTFSVLIVFIIIIVLVSNLFTNISKEILHVYNSYGYIFVIILLYAIFSITIKSKEKHYLLDHDSNGKIYGKKNSDEYNNNILKLNISDMLDVIKCITFGYVINILLIPKIFKHNIFNCGFLNSKFLVSLYYIIIACIIWEIINGITFLFMNIAKD